jgi:3-oxoacyl-[acyl-carrier protein] reductase
MDKPVALITGASRGIGAAIALELAQTHHVVINYASNDQAAKQVLDSLPFGEHLMIKADVSDEQAVEQMVKQVYEHYGQLDVLVNNAGITKDNLMIRMNKDDFTQVLDLNVTGTFLTTKAVSKIMIKQRRGKIINMASVIGLSGNIGQANYAASKGAMIAFTKSVAKELASRNINVNAIAPGFIDTDMTKAISETAQSEALKKIPLQRFGTPQQVAHLVAFLAGTNSDYITGQVIAIDGGMVIGV